MKAASTLLFGLSLVCSLVDLSRSIALPENEAKIAKGDINPLECSYEEVKGEWIFDVGNGGYDKTINCMSTGKISGRTRVVLDYPDIAKDDYGNVGFWTMVDSLGFEVVLHGRKFFAYVKFKSTSNGREVRFCNETILGSSHNVLGDDWACFFGRKVSKRASRQPSSDATEEIQQADKRSLLQLYRREADMLEKINALQSSWTAGYYEEYSQMTVKDLLSMAGNHLHRKNRLMDPAPTTEEQEKMIAGLPDSFDWRNVNGINYISPVRDQGKCGSCYAFTSAAMHEARLAIFTNRTVRVILSPQDVVDCTSYSLGCDGGSSYAIAGKYSEDYGMVEESCNPYRALEGTSCGTKTSCKRYYFTGYEYIGGYYGACNEALMLDALVKYGPLAIAIKVKEDLMFYKTGIYRSTGISSKFNPFVEVDHAVTLVGYGTDRTHGKYWIIKNSWGSKWGENGYFRLRRGINECGVESDAVQSFPIF